MKRHQTPGEAETNTRNRGQLILLGGIVVGIALVSLVLVLNGVLLAENMEAEQAVPEAHDAFKIQTLTHQEIGEMIIRLNDAGYGGSTEAYTRSNITQSAELLVVQKAETRPEYVQIGNASSVNNGRIVQQKDTSEFRNRTGNPNWELAETSNIRRFRMNVSTAELQSISPSDTETQSSLRPNTFYVEVTGSAGNTWYLYVYNVGVGNVYASTQTNNGPVEEHSTTDSQTTIGVTTGTINGSNEFTFAEGVSAPYEIRYVSGGRVSGNYTATFGGGVETDNLNSNGNSPYYRTAVYSATLPIEYTSPGFTYQGTLTVDPCTPDEVRCPVEQTIIPNNTVPGVGSGSGGGGGGGGGGPGGGP